MDLSFFRRSWLDKGNRSPAGLDYPVLVATLKALQSATPTARALLRSEAEGSASKGDQRPLATLLLGQPGWRAAALVQQGSFNRAVARNRVNLP